MTRIPAALTLKPDLVEADRRWRAYWAGELLDRPLVCATAPAPGHQARPESTYRDRVFGDLDAILDNALHNAAGRLRPGEAIPQFWMSFGPDEIASYCGAPLQWGDASGDTNWSTPVVDRWRDALPIRLLPDNPLWQRMLSFYRRAAERLGGKMLCNPLDLHTNLDLLAALRGPERLCMDLHDCPDEVALAVEDADRVFCEVWEAIRVAGRMNAFGYAHCGYSMDGVAVLQCDFSALIGPEMFRRWVRPSLEKEAAIVKHVIYHWDGPRALVHRDELLSMPEVHTVSFVPDPGEHFAKYLDLFRYVQAAGKGVQIMCTPDEIQRVHRELDPARTLYCTWAASATRIEELLDWLRRNT